MSLPSLLKFRRGLAPSLACALLLCQVLPLFADGAADDYIWMEGEKATSLEPASFQLPVSSGPNDILSDGKWVQISIDGDKVDGTVPDTGVILSYDFKAAHDGDFDAWLHVGYEGARCVFDWRIDQGNWQTVQNTENTVDVQELGVWAPVAWLDLGRPKLTAGPHTLQIRLDKTKNKDGKFDSLLFGLDAVCFAAKPFHPDGAIKPGDVSWMTDADKAAASQTFDIPASPAVAQTPVSLAGAWQYAGDDEVLVDDRLGPVKAAPSADALSWHAIQVPGDRNQLLPHETYVHRYYLRARVKVAPELADHSFVLHVPAESVVATVFVNGQSCGWTKNCWAVWDCDVTSAIKPGAVNEICVAFKDPFYALTVPEFLKHPHYLPYSFWHFNATNTLDMPILAPNYQTGFLLGAPALVVGGKAYTADVFAKPSVANKTLGLEVTVHNPTGAPVTAKLTNEVQPVAGGAAEKTFAAQDVTIPAGQDSVVQISEPWANPKLWWPDDPQQYNVVTRLAIDGKVIDERTTKFGFREWTWNGPEFKLNGIPFHGFADCDPVPVDTLLSHNQTMMRVWWPDEKTEALLDECDAKGMPLRRTGVFDGEGSSGFYGLNNPALWDNYRQQLLAWAKGQRNHPSIFLWSMENEISFINGHVVGQDDITTREMKKAADLLMQLDPTRPVMTDGGNANLEESLPVYGGHYMEPPLNTYPEGCYDRAAFAHRQVWPVTKDKPVLLGEAAFVTGIELADHATVGGEQVFLGQAEARPAMAMELRMLSEGYRWNGVNFQFWAGGQMPIYYNVWKPVAVLCRQWNWSFGSGDKVQRTLRIFNDSRSTDPIVFNWNLTVNGKKADEGTSTHTVAPGMNEEFGITVAVPEVPARQEGVLSLSLSRGGKTIFEDTKNVSVLPPVSMAVKAAGIEAASRVALFDPKGEVKEFLSSVKVPFTPLADLKQIPDAAKVLVVANGALDSVTSTSSQLSAWASGGSGRALIVLEQDNPLKFQALPGQMATDTNHGCLAFFEDAAHPALAGLQNKDFSTWGQDNFLYRNAYVKPASGGKSILQCDMKLADSALVEMQAGSGTMLLTQLLVGEKIKTSAVAQRLFLNLLGYANRYKLVSVDATLVADDSTPLAKAVGAIGLKFAKAPDPLAALAKPGSIAIIDATPVNLKALADNLPKVNTFTGSGGWIILNNLTPDGLAGFNQVVGFNHVIRPFRREKVTWPVVKSPLTAGLSSGNIIIGTGQQIVPYRAGDYPDTDGYGYVVDLDDIAPFATSTYSAWDNAVNNFTMADGEWRLIQNLPASDAVVPMKLPQPEKIEQITWVSDLNYEGTTKIQVTINGKDYGFPTVPNGDPQTFDFPDQPTASELTLKVVDWQHDPKKTADGKELVGIDNIYLKVARPVDFGEKVKPMLNVGAMVEYPRGKGGIVLCDVKFLDTEKNPANVGKKQVILATILRNLKAAFSGGKTIIAGGNLAFHPIDLSKQANQFRNEQGWFGDKQHTFAALPSGKQIMGGVSYDIYHFTTSPVPEAVMLGADGVPGNLADNVKNIPVNQKADALFFLQAARIDSRRNHDELRDDKKYEMADYIVHYADGKDEKVPIYAEISVDSYHQDAPTAIPGAQIAWTAPYDDKSSAVAYSMQWNNPRPEVEISSIDLVYGPDRRGVPALLAVTAAQVQ